MEVTFEINDCTSLCGKREQNINLKNVNCGSDSIEFVSKLTECVKEFTKKYVEERNRNDKEGSN